MICTNCYECLLFFLSFFSDFQCFFRVEPFTNKNRMLIMPGPQRIQEHVNRIKKMVSSMKKTLKVIHFLISYMSFNNRNTNGHNVILFFIDRSISSNSHVMQKSLACRKPCEKLWWKAFIEWISSFIQWMTFT